MVLRKLAKDEDSGLTGCPTVYLEEQSPDYLVVQADSVGVDVAAAVDNPLPGEAVVRIKRSVVEAAIGALHQESP